MLKPKLKRLTLPQTIPGAEKFNSWLDGILEYIENLCAPSVSGNITVNATKGRIAFHVPDFPIGIGVTTSTITARASAIMGLGTADLQLLTMVGSNLTLVADAARSGQTVYNFSSTAGGVASGKYFVWLKIFGYYFIVSVEC